MNTTSTRPKDRFTTVFSTKTARREKCEALQGSRESAKSHQDSGEIEVARGLDLELDLMQDSREESSEVEGKIGTPSPTPVRKRSRRSSRKGSMDKDASGRPTMSASVRRLRPSKALLQLETASVAECVQAMVEHRTEATLVTDATGTLTGILTDKDIALRVVAMGLDPDTTLAVDVMTPNPLCVSPRACAIEALEQMISGQFRHLPVADNGNGILDIAKCLYDAIAKIEQAYMASSNQFTATLQQVRQIRTHHAHLDANMSGNEASLFEKMRETLFLPTLSSIIDGSVDVPEISDDATTRQASLLMLQKNSSAVMVLRPNGEMVGILTTKDLMRRVLAVGKNPATCLVRDAMTGNPDWARLDTTILDALHLMHDGKFLHLPVLNDDGAVVGLADVLQVTCSVVHQMGSFQKQHTASVNPVWNKFWNSMLNPPSPPAPATVATVTPAAAPTAPPAVAFAPEPPIPIEAEFVYKITDQLGNTHRFTASAASLTALKATVAARLGAETGNLFYVDEEADTVLLFADTDLEHAVARARARGAAYVRLKVQASASLPDNLGALLDALPVDEATTAARSSGVQSSMMTQSKLERKKRKNMYTIAAIGLGVTSAAVAYLRKKA
ncbi:myosin-like protein [Achlya hypogyna]|uniref:Myosin-like protein n=1 Tax=Achlya hypogyna TaxID=1202772 RepID=A0A1V9ZF60_ACHHY|nr:myosin-like protein [Achlya hypogyna]